MSIFMHGVEIPDIPGAEGNIFDKSLLSRMGIADDTTNYDLQNQLGGMMAPRQTQAAQYLGTPRITQTTSSPLTQAPPMNYGQVGVTQTTSSPITQGQSGTVNAVPAAPTTGFPPVGDTLYRGDASWLGAGYGPEDTTMALTSTGGIPRDDLAGSQGGFRIRMRGPNGQYVFSRDHSWISHALANGWQVVGDDGGIDPGQSFGGGFLIGGVPINTALTGEMTQEQADALKAAGLWGPNAQGAKITASGGMPAGHDAGAGRITTGSPGSPTGNTGSPGPTTGIPGIDTTVPNNAKDVYKMLLEALLKRTAGADALSQAGVDFFGQMGRLGDQSAAQRDRFINELYPGIRDTISSFMANKDKAEGLSPEGKAALRQQLNEGIPDRFNQAAQALSTDLLRRGADTGQMPGSTGDIVRGYAPLYAARAGEYSKANRDVVLQDEAQKLQSLLANRQLASNAVGQGTGLTATLGSIYNPNQYYNTGLGGLQAGISGFGAGTQGLGVGAGLAGGLADLEPTSFKNILLASLLGTSVGGLTTILSNPAKIADAAKKVGMSVVDFIAFLGSIFGGKTGVGEPGAPEDI